MKRTALLLAILLAFSIISVEEVYASPIAGEKAVTVSSWLSFYIANFLRAHRVTLGSEEGFVVDSGDDVMLRGDADDYANGRGDEDGISPATPSGDGKVNSAEQD